MTAATAETATATAINQLVCVQYGNLLNDEFTPFLARPIAFH